jgi:hydrogenase nickel incorporation protein HypA/HybF
MHGMSMAQGLVDSVCAQAEENHINEVTKISVDIGSDSHISNEELQFCFRVACDGTIVSNAELEISTAAGDALILNSFTGE